MLTLCKQVDCDIFRIGCLIGYDQDLGGAGQRVNTDSTHNLPLGFCHITVARAGDQIDLSDALCTICHGCNRLCTADCIYLIYPANVHGNKCCRMDHAIVLIGR